MIHKRQQYYTQQSQHKLININKNNYKIDNNENKDHKKNKQQVSINSLISNNPIVKKQQNTVSIKNQIKMRLKQVIKQNNSINKLIIECILSSLYIQQYNYTQSYKILLQIQSTVQFIQSRNNKINNTRKEQSNIFQLSLIKLKMYSNFIIIQLINNQSEMLYQHLQHVFNQILYQQQTQNNYKHINMTNNNKNNQQNHNPNKLNSHPIDERIYKYKIFLKSLIGYQTFQEIQMTCLIQQSQQSYRNHKNIDYKQMIMKQFSISILKLLSSHNIQATYRLQLSIYNKLYEQYHNLQQNKSTQQQNIIYLLTISTRKLLYLSQRMQLPNQIIQKYKLQLSNLLKSSVLSGLQLNTLFRNYQSKIQLAQNMIQKIKLFQNQYIKDKLRLNHINQNKNIHQNNQLIKLWQYKAIKNKLLLMLAQIQSTHNHNNNLQIINTTQNIKLVLSYLQNIFINNLSNNIESSIILSLIKSFQSIQDQQQQKASVTLYQSSINQYFQRLSYLINKIDDILFIKSQLKIQVFNKIKKYYIQKNDVVLNNNKDKNKNKVNNYQQKIKSHNINKEQQDQQQQIDIDIDVQVVKSNQNKINYHQNKSKQQIKQIKKPNGNNNNSSNNFQAPIPLSLNINKQNKKNKQLNISQFKSSQINNNNIQTTKNNELIHKNDKNNKQIKQIQQINKIDNEIQNINKKSSYLNDKNSIYVNYTQLGSRVKLTKSKQQNINQNIITQSNQFLKAISSQKQFYKQNLIQSKYKKQNHKQIFKQDDYIHKYQQEQGSISIPNQDSLIIMKKSNYNNSQNQKYNSKFNQKYQNNNQKYQNNKQKYQNNKQKFEINKQKYEINKKKKQSLQPLCIQQQQEQLQQTPNKSILSAFSHNKSKSRQRHNQSAISPKHSTINSRLNQHVKKHQIATISPTNIRQQENINKKYKQLSISSHSHSKYGEQKSKSKNKVQKATSFNKTQIININKQYANNTNINKQSNIIQKQLNILQKQNNIIQKQRSKSNLNITPTNKSNVISNKTIKFQQFMAGLQKSGVNKNKLLTQTQQIQQHQTKKIHSKPKLQNTHNKKVQYKQEHKRNNTQSSNMTTYLEHFNINTNQNNFNFNNNQQYQNSNFNSTTNLNKLFQEKQKNSFQNTTSNILSYFMSDIQKINTHDKKNNKNGKSLLNKDNQNQNKNFFKKEYNKNSLQYSQQESQKQQQRYGKIYNQNNKQKQKQNKNKNIKKKQKNIITLDQFQKSPSNSDQQQQKSRSKQINNNKQKYKKQNQLKLKQTNSVQITNKGFLQNNLVNNIMNFASQLNYHNQQLKQKLKLCHYGQYIDKRHYTSDGGQQRFLRISQDNLNLQWGVTQQKVIGGNKKKYQIKNIRGIIYGKVTDTMKKQYNKLLQPWKCVSIIFHKRTFDIFCIQQKDLQYWLPGISYYINQSKQQLTHPNYTTKIQHLIKKKKSQQQLKSTHNKSLVQNNKNSKQVLQKLKQLHRARSYYSLGRVLWKRLLLKLQHNYLYSLKKGKKVKNYINKNAGAIIQFAKNTGLIQKNIQNQNSKIKSIPKQQKKKK